MMLAATLETSGGVVSVDASPSVTVRPLPVKASVYFLPPILVSPPATVSVPSSVPEVFTTVMLLVKDDTPSARL